MRGVRRKIVAPSHFQDDLAGQLRSASEGLKGLFGNRDPGSCRSLSQDLPFLKGKNSYASLKQDISFLGHNSIEEKSKKQDTCSLEAVQWLGYQTIDRGPSQRIKVNTIRRTAQEAYTCTTLSHPSCNQPQHQNQYGLGLISTYWTRHRKKLCMKYQSRRLDRQLTVHEPKRISRIYHYYRNDNIDFSISNRNSIRNFDLNFNSNLKIMNVVTRYAKTSYCARKSQTTTQKSQTFPLA